LLLVRFGSSAPEEVFKYHMEWQKRDSARAYNYKNGVGTLIVNITGKICAFGLRMSDYQMCCNCQEKDNVPAQKCSKNQSGSAEAMEPDVCINLKVS